ncbi:chalcone isomerase family protein [Chitinibacter tainanensis]|uniref:chalcone isomerase family protein n=1 Tax=Chitinibacter tainanensis TaxID=230667 RepID=UPI00040FAF5D|nr:chalcone isomerase family protein [Chitinibacter tainanensis]
MKKQILTVLLACAMQPLWAAEVAGIILPDQVELAGKSLQLNGAGVRKKLMFEVYVAALYTPAKLNDPAAVLALRQPRRLQLNMLRDVDGKTLVEALSEGLKDNLSAVQYTAHAARIAELEKLLLSAKEAKIGDVIQLDLLPGEGVRVQFRGKLLGMIAGDEFARDLLTIWLGNKPVQESLKQKLLAR